MSADLLVIETPPEIEALGKEIVELYSQISLLESLQSAIDDKKNELYQMMEESGLKKATLIDGTQISRVLPIEAKWVDKTYFDEKAFKEDEPELYKLYVKTEQKLSGARTGYLKITPPKGD